MGISVSYVGFSKEILSPEEVLRFFDSLWGEDSRRLPAYPEVIGKISASWHSADGNLHQVDHIDELIEAYKKKVTYDIQISGSINNRPRLLFNYIPAHKKATCVITAKTEKKGTAPFFLDKNVFSCYHTNMPRIARIVALDYPHHVTQRGNFRQNVFEDDRDRKNYLAWIPVRAKLVAKPWQWGWSTAQAHIDEGKPVIQIGDIFNLIGMRPAEWEKFISEDEDITTINSIRKHTLVGRPMGDDQFINKLSKRLGRKFPVLERGRPKKKVQ